MNDHLLLALHEINRLGANPITQYDCKSRADFMRHVDKMREIAFEAIKFVEGANITLADQVKKAIEETTLPEWMIVGIRQIAYDIGHSNGQEEVDGWILEYIYIFEQLQK